jgi:hypothetical protein
MAAESNLSGSAHQFVASAVEESTHSITIIICLPIIALIQDIAA